MPLSYLFSDFIEITEVAYRTHKKKHNAAWKIWNYEREIHRKKLEEMDKNYINNSLYFRNPQKWEIKADTWNECSKEFLHYKKLWTLTLKMHSILKKSKVQLYQQEQWRNRIIEIIFKILYYETLQEEEMIAILRPTNTKGEVINFNNNNQE